MIKKRKSVERTTWGNQRGQAMVEFAIAIIFFLACLLMLGDLTRICYTWVSVQHALQKGTRWASLGQTLPPLNRVESIKQRVRDVANQLQINLDEVTVSSNGLPDSAGLPNDFLTVTATENVTVNHLTGIFLRFVGDHGGTYVVSGSATVKNEPF